MLDNAEVETIINNFLPDTNSEKLFSHQISMITYCSTLTQSAVNRMLHHVLLNGIEYNSSTKGKYPNSKEIVTTGSTENCESEKWDTEVEKDKKVSFDNVTNAG